MFVSFIKKESHRVGGAVGVVDSSAEAQIAQQSQKQ